MGAQVNMDIIRAIARPIEWAYCGAPHAHAQSLRDAEDIVLATYRRARASKLQQSSSRAGLDTGYQLCIGR